MAPSSQTISSSAIDGSGLRTVFSGSFGLLGPIVVDSQTKLIFWSDIDLYIVESGSFDGRGRRVVVKSVWQSVGLAVHGDFLYWADKKSRSLERASKVSGLSRQLLKSKLSNLNDFVLVYDQDGSGRPTRSRCLQKNLRCSHLCVQHEDGATVRCACPIGLVLDFDGQTCVLSLPCAVDQVACPSGLNHPCIPLKWKCDGEADCGDRSDEANCASCSSGFSCSTGECVALDRRCNGQRDCFDGSDEKECTACRRRDDCTNDRTCFTRSQQCDGVVDCWDGYDELNCVHRTARPEADVQNSLVVIGVLCGILVVTFLITVIYLCRHGARRCFGVHGKTGSPNLGSLPESLKCSPLCSVTSIQSCQGQKYAAQSNAIVFDEIPDLYENLVHLDTSIRASSTSHYSHLSQNPPPTPVTSDTATTTNRHDSDGMSALWCRNRCRKHRHVPPPTPCSTDVCDDSELYSANEQHRFLSNTDAGFETDFLYPPPPTPCSQFLPDGYSGPPSPGGGPSPFYSGSFASSLNFS